jgi:hypothetical protein
VFWWDGGVDLRWQVQYKAVKLSKLVTEKLQNIVSLLGELKYKRYNFGRFVLYVYFSSLRLVAVSKLLIVSMIVYCVLHKITKANKQPRKTQKLAVVMQAAVDWLPLEPGTRQRIY